MKILKTILPFLIFAVIAILPSVAHAQGADPGCSPDDPCPIDGGLILLIAAGVGVAAMRSYNKKNRSAKQAI